MLTSSSHTNSIAPSVRLQVFHGKGASALRGNSANIFYLPQTYNSEQMQNIASQYSDVCCFLTQQKSGYRLNCFNPTQAIECCGHGAFAASRYLNQQDKTALTLEQSGCDIQIDTELGIGLASLEVEAAEIPAWCSQLIPTEIIDCALAGGENGYLVLELDADINLAALKLDLRILSKHSQRALILTQWPGCKNQTEQNTYFLRYFAPQYGTDEDAVTASAQRVLAPYWQQKKFPQQSICNFAALQLSSSGGKLLITKNNNTVWISGSAAVLTSE